ncbi:MAG: magnesium transporter CorA, partial [Clostridia bacterium]|nr:magnesium transporter CorA [Clostridia bacterium]
MYYLIRESLTPCAPEEIRSGGEQFVAVLTGEEWKTRRDSFDMIIDMDMETANPRETKAVVNLDSLTGTFSFPDRQQISGPRHNFSFALDERGIIFVDDTGYAERTILEISRTKKWRLPSLERFLYDLLEVSIRQDLSLLEGTEHRLNII